MNTREHHTQTTTSTITGFFFLKITKFYPKRPDNEQKHIAVWFSSNTKKNY